MSDHKSYDPVLSALKDHLMVVGDILANDTLRADIVKTADLCLEALRNHGKILLCGNGGSAADAQHIAAELSGRYLQDRAPLFAEALHVNTSYLTAVGNDYDFSRIYARAVEAKGSRGDVLICLSTSGNSKNIVEAVKQAQSQQITTIGLTGQQGGQLKILVDLCLCVPSMETPRIQEAHILIGHILCDIIEKALFPSRIC